MAFWWLSFDVWSAFTSWIFLLKTSNSSIHIDSLSSACGPTVERTYNRIKLLTERAQVYETKRLKAVTQRNSWEKQLPSITKKFDLSKLRVVRGLAQVVSPTVIDQFMELALATTS